jgi:hypothetical protein
LCHDLRHSGIFLVRLLKATDELSQGSLFWGLDLNPAPFEYGVLSTRLRRSVASLLVVIMVIRSMRMGWTGHVAHIGES